MRESTGGSGANARAPSTLPAPLTAVTDGEGADGEAAAEGRGVTEPR